MEVNTKHLQSFLLPKVSLTSPLPPIPLNTMAISKDIIVILLKPISPFFLMLFFPLPFGLMPLSLLSILQTACPLQPLISLFL